MPRYWKKFGGKKWITWIGLIGWPITAMFWMIIFDNHALNVIASFICALLIPLLAVKIMEHSKILSFLLVGKYPNKEVKMLLQRIENRYIECAFSLRGKV